MPGRESHPTLYFTPHPGLIPALTKALSLVPPPYRPNGTVAAPFPFYKHGRTTKAKAVQDTSWVDGLRSEAKKSSRFPRSCMVKQQHNPRSVTSNNQTNSMHNTGHRIPLQGEVFVGHVSPSDTEAKQRQPETNESSHFTIPSKTFTRASPSLCLSSAVSAGPHMQLHSLHCLPSGVGLQHHSARTAARRSWSLRPQAGA